MSIRLLSGLLLMPLLVMSLACCDFAPDYRPPSAPSATSFKQSAEWKRATPSDAVPRGAWWRIFGDARLDQLEQRLEQDSPNLKQALARYDQATAAARVAGSTRYPTLSIGANGQREQRSRESAIVTHPNLYNDGTLQANFSWEIDLWGRVRNIVAAADDRASAGAADLAGAKLALQAQLASDYLALQGYDAQQDMLERTVISDQDALDFTQRRHAGGVAAEVDVDQAESQLASARTQATNNRLLRAQLEHAIAILVGAVPAEFSLSVMTLAAEPPSVAVGLPSSLLERRPDIAAAERRVAAANADIGVARAAFFPVFDLAALGGVEAALPSHLFNSAAAIWAFGPQAAGPLFDGGLRSASVDQSRAAFNEAVAIYQQNVLIAYREVEDNLAALRQLEQESRTQATAVAAARRALAQAQTRYKGGLATYLEVISAQNVAVTAESSAIDIGTRRMVAAVQLIQAIGGGWEGLQQTAEAQ